MSTHIISMRLICHHPPTGTFGLQDKRQNLLVGQALVASQIYFDFDVKVKRLENGRPNFTGSYTHGTVQERFLYLTLKTPNEIGEEVIFQRTKVHLKSIAWEQIEAILQQQNAFLQAAVDARRSGSVPLLDDGWVVMAPTTS
jgi:hypothetical protein